MDLAELQLELDALSEDDRRTIALWLKKREREDRAARRRKQCLASAVRWSILSLAAFFSVDAALFRSGWYIQYLEPNSSAGNVEKYLYWLRQEPPAAAPEIVVIGDSRVAEGFSARQANARVEDRLKFWNFGIGGASPRDWYYILRDADPTRRRFAAIVLAMDQYADQDSFDHLPDRLLDLNYVIGRLRLSDCWDFAASMTQWENRTEALSGCLFKGMTLRRDVRAFLLDRKSRLTSALDWRLNGLGYISGYDGKTESLRGLWVDRANSAIHYPPQVEDPQKWSIAATVTPQPAPQTGEMTRYRERWLGGMLELYKLSPTRMILLQLPRAPLAVPEQRAPARFVQSISGRPRVITLPANTFGDLERPEVFADGLHLNREGRALFSRRLADRVAAILAGD